MAKEIKRKSMKSKDFTVHIGKKCIMIYTRAFIYKFYCYWQIIYYYVPLK